MTPDDEKRLRDKQAYIENTCAYSKGEENRRRLQLVTEFLADQKGSIIQISKATVNWMDQRIRELDCGKVCEWKENEDGQWETGCGEMFEFTTGGLKENKVKWCQYCGGKIVEVRK